MLRAAFVQRQRAAESATHDAASNAPAEQDQAHSDKEGDRRSCNEELDKSVAEVVRIGKKVASTKRLISKIDATIQRLTVKRAQMQGRVDKFYLLISKLPNAAVERLAEEGAFS